MKRITLPTRKAKTFLVLLLLWTMTAGAWADDQGSLFIMTKDGKCMRFVLPVQKPIVTFGNGVMEVSLSDHTFIHFDRDEVDYLTVDTEEPQPNGIALVEGDEHIQFDLTRKNVVRISGLQKDDLVQVFALDGKSISTPISRHDGEAVVDLSQQRRGVYMVSVNQRFTFKLMKP